MKIAAILVASLCVLPMASAQAIMEPADRPVTLTGTIRMVHGYGPPGYGEDKKSDARVSYLVIELPKPINIPCTPERPEWASIDCGPAKRLKLFFLSSSGDEIHGAAKRLIGQKVTLVGTLQRSDTVGEMTPIYIEVTEIKAATNVPQTKLP